MGRYQVFWLLHVGGAIVWVGAAFLMTVLGARIGRARDESRRLAYAQDSEWLGQRLYLPSSLLTLIFGVLLVHYGERSDWSQLWVQLGIAALVLSSLLGMAVFAPGWKRVNQVAVTEGTGSPRVRGLIERLLVLGWLDVGILASAVFLMRVKPGGDDAVALVVSGVLPVLAAVVGLAFRAASRPGRSPTLNARRWGGSLRPIGRPSDGQAPNTSAQCSARAVS